MNGLELSKAYYLEYGKPMLESEFKDYIDKIAVGLVGHGSECFGYDDELSKDHDYEPGFCIWIDDETEKEIGFKLFRAYMKLPNEYMGIKIKEKSIYGSKFKGVHTIKEFYSFYTGNGDVPQDLEHWLSIPDFYLAEATNGEVFVDNQGEFSRIRNGLLKNRPEDVRLKKLASALFTMAQAGQYNYARCIGHKENTSAALALSDFVKNTANAIYLINKKYAPYYKWLFKGIDSLDKLNNIKCDLDTLMKDPYNSETNVPLIEKISKEIIKELIKKNLVKENGDYLESYAYQVNDNIKDNNLRNSSIIL